MIIAFKNSAMRDLWFNGTSSKINRKVHERILRKLDYLNAAATTKEMNLAGFDFHPLHGFKPTRYSIHINGPWFLTFSFSRGDAYSVDFEQYH
jgi:toxin HigB-1